MSLPKISVLIPSFNQAPFLLKTLATLARQEYPALEVIIADGGSHDRTAEVVDAYGDLVTHFISEPDQGQLHGMAKAIAQASGDIYYWLNADDLAMPGACHAAAQAFIRHPEAEIVYSDSCAFNEPKREWYYSEYLGNLDFWTHFLFYRQWCSESIYWRAEITEQALPLDYSLRVYTDYSFFLPLRYGRKCQWIRHKLGAFRVQPMQMSQVNHARGDAERELIKQRMRERLGMSMEEYQQRQQRQRLNFQLYQRLLPKTLSAARYALRKVTGDVLRRRYARQIFSQWLRVPAEIEARLGADFCRYAEALPATLTPTGGQV